METKTKRRFRLRWVLIPLAVLLITAYIALVNILVSAALVPSFMRKLEAFETITEESYAQQVDTGDIRENRSSALSEMDEWLASAECTQLECTSSDGYKLVAACFSAPHESHAWVILLHGYTGWKEEMYPFACRYQQEGFNVLAPDLRCQGGSEGDFIGMGWTDRLDVLLWIDLILEQDPDAEIVLHGQSMGAACALIMSGMDGLPANVRAVISDCAYTDAYSMFKYYIREWFNLPAFPLVDSANIALQLRGGYNLKDASALDAVKHSAVPILFIHGDQDMMIPVDSAYELYDAASSEKELLIVEGAGHAQSQDKDPERYYGTVFGFLAKYMEW